MTFKNIIKDEIRGNIPTYKEYFLATILSVTVIFMSLMILYHPQMQVSSLSKNFVMAAKAVTVIIAVFLFIFIYYSQYTFLRHRSRDYALFSILGMKRSQLTLLNFWESFTVFFCAFVSGILIALLFAKLIFMAFAALLDIDQMGLYFPSTALAITAALFIIVFIVIEIISAFILRKTQVKEFLQFGQVAQKQKKINYPVAIIGALLILGGYFLAVTADETNLLKRIFPVCMMVIAGMYCFYREICPLILQALSKNKRFYYKGVNLLWVSDLKYRIKDFTMMLFLITVTMTVGLTGFTAVFNVASAELEFDTMKDSRFPVAVMSMALKDSTERPIAASSPQIPTVTKVENLIDSLGMSYQETSVKLYSYITKSRVLIQKSDMPIFMKEEDLSCFDFKGEDTLVIGIRGREMNVALPFRNIVVVEDDKVQDHIKGYDEVEMTLFEGKEPAGMGKGLMKITDSSIIVGGERTDIIYSSSLFRYFYFIARRSYLLLSFYFVIIFYICSGCMLYFKFFNNAREEGLKYSNYSKVGLSVAELKRSSTIQMASLFFLPMIMTVLNTSFAMYTIRGSVSPLKFWSNTLSILLFTVAVQVIYFFIIRRSYLKKLTPRE